MWFKVSPVWQKCFLKLQTNRLHHENESFHSVLCQDEFRNCWNDVTGFTKETVSGTDWQKNHLPTLKVFCFSFIMQQQWLAGTNLGEIFLPMMFICVQSNSPLPNGKSQPGKQKKLIFFLEEWLISGRVEPIKAGPWLWMKQSVVSKTSSSSISSHTHNNNTLSSLFLKAEIEERQFSLRHVKSIQQHQHQTKSWEILQMINF